MEQNLLIDLYQTIADLNSKDIKDREQELAKNLPLISLYAVGGFPITKIHNKFFLLKQMIDLDTLTRLFTSSIGLSGMLTHMNKSNLSSGELGLICKEKKHLWAENWMTVSFLIASDNPEMFTAIEKSLLRHNKFYQSWSIDSSNNIFGITGSIKDFKKFISNKNDKSFDVYTRAFMNSLYEKFSFLW